MSVADQARAIVARTTAAQGLAPPVTDPVVLARVASILVSGKVPDDDAGGDEAVSDEAVNEDGVVISLPEREAACEVIPLARYRARSSP